MKQLSLFGSISLLAIVGYTAYDRTASQKDFQTDAYATVEPTSKTHRLNPSMSASMSASMTDTEILMYFGLDIESAEVSQVQGKDGIQMTYILGERRVSIVRSQVSGLAVVAKGTDPAGAWSFDNN